MLALHKCKPSASHTHCDKPRSVQAPEPEEEEEEEAGEDEDGGDEGEDEVAPETPERDDDAASAGDDGDEAAMEDEEEEPDSPTTGYQRGGLGMGSRFFSADDVKCASARADPGSDQCLGFACNPLPFVSCE